MIATVSGCPVIGPDCLSFNLALLQNLPSILCGHVLNPLQNEIILDMCAAPGNKTSHLAMLMGDQVSVCTCAAVGINIFLSCNLSIYIL